MEKSKKCTNKNKMQNCTKTKINRQTNTQSKTKSKKGNNKETNKTKIRHKAITTKQTKQK
jgi:hypothetical protein